MGSIGGEWTMRWRATLSRVSNSGPDYEGALHKERQKNIKELQQEVITQSTRLKVRVQNYVEKFGYDEAQVWRKIKEDKMFAVFFAKDPSKQTLHERVAAEWIKGLESQNLCIDFKKLPQSGRQAQYITGNGKITTLDKGDNKPSKALDFYWKTGTRICYATHKWTYESQGGGAQDNQKKDVITTIQNFIRCPDKSVVLFALLDGPYYHKEARMEAIKRDERREKEPYCYVINSSELPQILKELLEQP